jgi:DNA repair protein RadC
MRGLVSTDRPREKLARLGASGLGDNELLAIVLGAGIRTMNALGVANVVLECAGGLHRLARLSSDELQQIRGLGTAKASQVLAAIELGRRTLLRAPDNRVQLLTPRETAVYLLPQFGGRPVEQFGIVLLDTKYRVLRTMILSIGTLDRSVVHPREVFREACAAAAAAVVLFHNHPSGDPAPSPDDVLLTDQLVRAGHVMGIPVADHVIIGDTAYYSFREQRRLV